MNTTILRTATSLSALAALCTLAPASATTVARSPFRAPLFTQHAPYLRPHAPAQSIPYDAKNKKLLYVGDNANNQISVFNITTNQQNSKPIGVISAGLAGPQGITTDLRGNLYVTNLYGNSVTIYAPGQTTPAATLTQGINTPTDVKVDSAGNVYVSNSPGLGAQSFIQVYSAGSSSPSFTFTTPLANQEISGIALEAPMLPNSTFVEGVLYTLDSNGFATGSLFECVRPTTQCYVGLGPTFGQTGGIAVAQSTGLGKAYQTAIVDEYVPGVDMFSNGSLTQQLVTGGTPEFLAFNAGLKNLFVTDRFYGRVTEYSYPAGQIVNQFYPAAGGSTPQLYGVAVTPAGTYH